MGDVGDAYDVTTQTAAWRHRGAREGFEAVFLRGRDDAARGGPRVAGHVAAVEDGRAWAVRYEIELDPAWRTRRAWISGESAAGRSEVTLNADGAGRWRVDGAPAPHLDGCLDVDLEASACTNAFPVHRLGLAAGAAAEAPAAYVRALDLGVERLEQRYERVADEGDRRRYRYAAPAFAFEAVLVYDASGLVLEYPGIAVRAA